MTQTPSKIIIKAAKSLMLFADSLILASPSHVAVFIFFYTASRLAQLYIWNPLQ